MKKTSLQAKLAYCAQTRRSNYIASLRLEGFDVTQEESKRELPTREAVLRIYRKSA
ncbi:YhfG family protein [Serratia fonticola]|uniref:YhfG family protein n=1 Tax=Serratia fonticola TaxID=47917 RepID=UPI003BB72E74